MLFHRDLGGEGLPPLVILHGFLGSSRNWQTAGRDLASNFHVLAPDLRNHGSSPHLEPMTYAAMVDDVLGWMDAQGVASATLIGHSMGGKVAMLLACRHAGRVTRLSVVDIAPKAYSWPERREEFAALRGIDLAELGTRAEAAGQIETAVPDWASRQFLLTNLERTDDAGWKWAANLPALEAALGELEQSPLLPADRYDGPVLFLLGERSRYILPADIPAVNRHFPCADIRTIPGAGHNPHMEAREKFVEAVRGWAV